MKLTVTKSKNSASFFVQKTIRKSNGHVSSVTVEKLGNLDAVRKKAGGADPYAWAREYVEELNRREKEGQQEIIQRFSQTKLIQKGQKRRFNTGYLFLQDIYYELGIDRICSEISERNGFRYDLDGIFSRLVYSRILYPDSKRATFTLSKRFLEQPTFGLHQIYRALSVLSGENDFIQEQLFSNNPYAGHDGKGVLYYDCTNYSFEIEQEDDFRRFGHAKNHRPSPIVQMGLFMDRHGMPLAFDLSPGNTNEQLTLKPLEEKVIHDLGIGKIVVCTDAGLSGNANRRFNNRGGRSFITTQSIKTLTEELQDFCLSPEGWRLPGSDAVYDIRALDEEKEKDRIFFKETWLPEDRRKRKKEDALEPDLEQHLIVTYSIRYRDYLRSIRNGQIERARKMVDDGRKPRRGRNQNDPARFVACDHMTQDGESADGEVYYLDSGRIDSEERYDGFYAVCTNLDEDVSTVIGINKNRWQIEECFRILKSEFNAQPIYLQREDRIRAHFIVCFTALLVYRILERKLDNKYTCEEILNTLLDMEMFSSGEKMGYVPLFERTDITDALHKSFGFRTDYEIMTDSRIRQIIKKTKV